MNTEFFFIKGYFTNEKGNHVGANVFLKELNMGTIGGMDGEFYLELPTLNASTIDSINVEFTYIGYNTRTVELKRIINRSIRIEMTNY